MTWFDSRDSRDRNRTVERRSPGVREHQTTRATHPTLPLRPQGLRAAPRCPGQRRRSGGTPLGLAAAIVARWRSPPSVAAREFIPDWSRGTWPVGQAEFAAQDQSATPQGGLDEQVRLFAASDARICRVRRCLFTCRPSSARRILTLAGWRLSSLTEPMSWAVAPTAGGVIERAQPGGFMISSQPLRWRTRTRSCWSWRATRGVAAAPAKRDTYVPFTPQGQATTRSLRRCTARSPSRTGVVSPW